MKRPLPVPIVSRNGTWPGTVLFSSELGILASICLLLVACGGSSAPFEPRQLIAVNVQPNQAVAVPPGGTLPFTASGAYNQAPTNQPDLPVQWVSSNAGIATIDPSTGTAQCLALGPVTITASAPGKGGTVRGSAVLSCQDSPSPAVTVNPPSLSFDCRPGGQSGGGTSACGCGDPKPATVTNVGSAALATDSIDVAFNPYYARISQTDNCGASLDPGQSCVISVLAMPASHIGNETGSIRITDSAGDSPQQIALHAVSSCTQAGP